MKISISTNFADVAKALTEMHKDVASQATARAVNRTMEQAKTAMSREIRSQFNMSAAYVRDRLRIKRAYAKAGQFTVSAELVGGDGKRRSANVIGFSARKASDGVSVQISRGKRKTIKGAFIGNKGRTVFRRVGDSRLPIEPKRTVDVPQMFTTRKVNAAVIRAIQSKLPAIFEREARYALSRFGK